MPKTFPGKIGKSFYGSIFSTFFVLSRFRVFLSDGSSKTLQKTFLQKNRQKSKTDFFLILFYHVFGRFSVRGVFKNTINISLKSGQLWYFFGLRGP
jgi:hypothetical protein